MSTNLDSVSDISTLEAFCHLSIEVQEQNRRSERQRERIGHAFLNVAQGQRFTGMGIMIEPDRLGGEMSAVRISAVRCEAFPHRHL